MKQYIVTIKKYQKGHNPHKKQTKKCLVSSYCTDSTGHHHSVLVEALTEEKVRQIIAQKYGYHITRIEVVDQKLVEEIIRECSYCQTTLKVVAVDRTKPCMCPICGHRGFEKSKT
jgi:hypothetical protein